MIKIHLNIFKVSSLNKYKIKTLCYKKVLHLIGSVFLYVKEK